MNQKTFFIFELLTLLAGSLQYFFILFNTTSTILRCYQLNSAIIVKVGRGFFQRKIFGLNNNWIEGRAVEVGARGER